MPKFKTFVLPCSFDDFTKQIATDYKLSRVAGFIRPTTTNVLIENYGYQVGWPYISPDGKLKVFDHGPLTLVSTLIPDVEDSWTKQAVLLSRKPMPADSCSLFVQDSPDVSEFIRLHEPISHKTTDVYVSGSSLVYQYVNSKGETIYSVKGARIFQQKFYKLYPKHICRIDSYRYKDLSLKVYSNGLVHVEGNAYVVNEFIAQTTNKKGAL